MNTERLSKLALNLNRTSPRSPYAALGNVFPAVADRLVDKCRAELLGQGGSYEYNCPMDRMFFAATGVEPELLREFIATGADDNEVATWMSAHATVPGRLASVKTFTRARGRGVTEARETTAIPLPQRNSRGVCAVLVSRVKRSHARNLRKPKTKAQQPFTSCRDPRFTMRPAA
jgi:hypothetical protein